ncbi:AMP-binding protein [Streptomyces sp. NPDC092129]|uniref:AMP-binding protein n=1 Tax=Streptomyces sp. NPDC092129 TaxID=3366010 RepID=UPI0037FF4A0A
MRNEAARFAGVLTDCGVVKGDRVVIYMPMLPHAAIAMLACARIGAVPAGSRLRNWPSALTMPCPR